MTAPGKSRGLLRKLAISTVAAVAALGAVAAVPFFVDWNAVREAAEREGTRQLGRAVTIERIRAGVFLGVEMGGFSVGPRPRTTAPPLVRADRVVARIRLLPLFLLRVVIHRVDLVAPELKVSRSRGGAWSFSDLLARRGENDRRGGDGRGRIEGKRWKAQSSLVPSSPVPVSLEVSTFRIRDGVLEFRDASVKPARAAGATALNLMISDLNLEGRLTRVSASAEASMGGEAAPVRLKGRVGLDLVHSRLVMKDMAVTFPGVRSATSGDVRDLHGIPSCKVENHTVVDLAEAWEGFRRFTGRSLGDGLEPAGEVDIRMDLRRAAGKLKFGGTAGLRNVRVRHGGWPGTIEELEGTIMLDNDRVSTTNLRLITFGSPFTFMCDIRNLRLAAPGDFSMRGFSPRGRFVVESPRLVLDRFFPERGGEGAAPPGNATVPGRGGRREGKPGEPDLRRMLPRGADLDGELHIKDLRYGRLSAEDVSAEVRVAKGNAAGSVRSSLYSGRLSGSAEVRMTKCPLEFKVAARMEKVALGRLAGDLVETFAADAGAWEGRVSGSATTELRLSGKGVTPRALREEMSGWGKIRVDNGEVSRLRFFRRGLGRLLDLRFLSRGFRFRALTGDFSVGVARITTSDLKMDPGEDGDLGLEYRGWLGFSTRMSGEMGGRFHPRHARRLRRGGLGGGFFTDEEGWLVADWDVRGTFFAPELEFSRRPARKRAKEVVRDRAPGIGARARGLLRRILGE